MQNLSQYKAKKGTAIKSTAMLVAVLFLFTDILFFPSQALGQIPSSSIVQGGESLAGFQSQPLYENGWLPPELGSINEVYRAPGNGEQVTGSGKGETDNASGQRSSSPIPRNDRMIVFIQDAHDSLEGQENIAKIIRLLTERYGAATVFQEGYEGPVPTDELFGFIQDSALKQKISWFFLDKLRLRAAEYAHINQQSYSEGSTAHSNGAEFDTVRRTPYADWQLIGADSLKLHQENIDQYRLSAEKKETIERDLSAIEKELKLLAARRFPKEFREWMKVKEQFDAKKLDLFTYLERTFPLVLGGNRQTINKKQADLNAYRSSLSTDAATPLLRFILEAVSSDNAVVLEKAKHIDAREVFAELLNLERMIAETYLADRDGGTRRSEARSRRMDPNVDLQLYDHYKTIQLLKRLNSLEVTQEEYAALLVQRPASGFRHDTPLREDSYHLEVSTQCLAEFIHSQTKKPLVLSKQWERNIQDAVKFYEIALQRDDALSTALGKYFPADQRTQYSKLSGVEPGILVYGGFHKENIKRILEAKGISYVVVSPRITQPSSRHEAYYKQLMTEGFHKFELPFLLRTAASQPTLVNLDPQVARAEIRAVYEAAIRYPDHPKTWDRHLDSTNPGNTAREISPKLESIQEVDRRSEVRGEAGGKKRNSIFQMSWHSFLKMGLLFFAAGFFSMAHVGGAQPSVEGTIFRQGNWNVLGTRDTGPASEKIRTSAGLPSEIKIVNGRHQIFSVKGNGFLRGTLPGMDWGTSFVLPGYWSDGRYFHNPRITHASFDLDEKGELRLKGVFEDQNGNFVSDDFEIVFSTAPRGEALMKVSFTMKAKKDFTLDQERLRNHDGFRIAQFSSMNVGLEHDADTAEYEGETGERIETKLENKNRFIFSEPRPLGPARTFYLKNKNPVPGRNNPTTYIRLAESMDPSQFTPQGWVTESRDVNDDNVGAWIHFDAVKPRYRAGETIGRFEFILGIAPNRSEARNQPGEMEESTPALTTNGIQGRELQYGGAFLDREWPDFETINIGEQNGKTISVKDTLESELPAARFAFEKMMQLRGWMDRNGKENVPLVIWQNMRLGELYPYLGSEIKKIFGILELTKEQYRHLAYSPDPIPGKITASRYLLIKDKVPSSFPSEGSSYDGSPEEEWDSSLVLWLVKDIKRLGEKLKAPVLMIDHSSRPLSGAQDIVKAGEKDTAVVFEESPGSFQAIKTTLDKNGTAMVILNAARGTAVRPGASVFDRLDGLFLEKNPEKKVRVSGQELNFFDAFRKVYETAILKESLRLETPDRSQETTQLPTLAETRSGIRAVTPKNTSRARHWYFLSQLFRALFFKKVLGLDFSQGEHRVVDVGVGALPVTTVEMAERFQKEIPGAISTGRIEMIGIEIPEAVPYAHITAEGLVDKFMFRLSERPMEESFRRWDLKAITLTINEKKEVTGAFASFDSESGTHYRDIAIRQGIPYLNLGRFYKGRQGDLLKEMIEFLDPEKIRYALSQGVSGTFDGISVELNPVRNKLEKAGVKLVVTDNPWSAGVRDVRLMTVFNVIQHIPQEGKLRFLEQLAQSLKEGKAERGKLIEMGGILAVKGGRLDGTPSFAETYYTNVNGHLVEIETTLHNFNHAVMSGQELGGFSVNFEERKLKPVWISADGAQASRSEVRMQQKLRDKGEFIESLADASLRLTRHLYDNDFHAVLASGDSAEIPLRLVTTAWQTLYPDEPFPLQFVFDGQENNRLYRDWAALRSVGEDGAEEQRYFLERAKELIDEKKSLDGRKRLTDFKEGKLIFVDSLISTGFKTGMLKMVFKDLGFKNIAYATLYASDPKILRVLHPDVFVAEPDHGKIEELGDLDHDLSILRKNEPARVKLTMEEIQETLTLVQKAITNKGLSLRSELRSDFPETGKSFFTMERFRSVDELRLTNGSKIPVSVTQEHHEIIEWIKSLQKQGIATPETTIVNFDAHPDTVNENLHEGSWVYWIREPEHKTGNVISKGRMVWVRGQAYEPTLRGMWPDELEHGYGSLKENIFKDGSDQLKGHLSGPAIITLDLDFLGSSDERAVSLEEVEGRIQSFLRAVFESEIQPIALHISISEKYLAKVRDYMDLPAGMAPRRDEAISQVLVESIQLKGMRFSRQGTDLLFEPRSEIRSSLNDSPEGVPQAEKQEGSQEESNAFQISQDPDFPEILNRVKILLESYRIPGWYPEDEKIRSLLTVVLDPRTSDSGKQDKIRECLPSLARKFLSDLCRQIEEIGFPLSAKVMTGPDLIQRLDEFLLRPARQAYEQGKLERAEQLLEIVLSVTDKVRPGVSDLLELFMEAQEIKLSLQRIEAWFVRRLIDDKGAKVIRPTDLPATLKEWEAFSQEERKIIQRARANGEKLKWIEKMHNALIEPVINRAQRINNLQKFIVQGRTSLQKQFAMTVMIVTNWMIDLFFIYPLVKMPTIAGALWLGRATGLGVLQVAIVAGAAVLLNIEGGLVRLFLIYPVFKLIWPKLLRINRKGLIVNFVPSGPGNFAPFLFFNPTLGIDMPLALKERYLISRQVEKALAYYPGITEKIIVDITESIYQAELQIGDSFNYRRFKIRRAKEKHTQEAYTKKNGGESKNPLISFIKREDLSNHFPFYVKLKDRFFRWVGFPAQGYRKGTRPTLLIGDSRQLKKIKQFLKSDGLSEEQLGRVYQLDLTKYFQKIGVSKKTFYGKKPLAGEFIQPMFPTLEENTHQPQKGKLKKTAQKPKGLGSVRPGGDKKNRSELRQPSNQESQVPDVTWEELKQQGYDLYVSRDQKKGEDFYEWVGVVKKDGRILEGSNFVLQVFPKSKFICILLFFPAFPIPMHENDKNGKGRALLRELLALEDYTGFSVVSMATGKFPASLAKIKELHPVVELTESPWPMPLINSSDPEIQKKIKTLYEGVENAADVSDAEKDEVLGALGEATFIGEVTAPFHGLSTAREETQGRSESRSNSAESLDVLINRGRVRDIIDAMEEFREIEASEGNEIQGLSVFGSFRPSNIQMIEDLVRHFDIGTKRKKILETGFGDGLTAAILAEATGADVVGIEPDPDRFQAGADFLEFLKMAKGIELPNLRLLRDDLLVHEIDDYDLIYFYYTPPLGDRESFPEKVLAKMEKSLKAESVFVAPILGSEDPLSVLDVETRIVREFIAGSGILAHRYDRLGTISTSVFWKKESMKPNEDPGRSEVRSDIETVDRDFARQFRTLNPEKDGDSKVLRAVREVMNQLPVFGKSETGSLGISRADKMILMNSNTNLRSFRMQVSRYFSEDEKGRLRYPEMVSWIIDRLGSSRSEGVQTRQSSMEKGHEEKRFVPGATDRVESAGSLLRDSQGVVFSENDLQEKMSLLFSKAGIHRRNMKGLITRKGVYFPSAPDTAINVLGTMDLSGRKRVVILDAGHGQGELVFYLAKMIQLWYPDLEVELIGIEFEDEIFDESKRLLEVFKQEELSGKISIQFHQGDFNSEHFEPLFQKADYVYYFSKGTNDIRSFARTLEKTMNKPGAKIVEYGEGELAEYMQLIHAPVRSRLSLVSPRIQVHEFVSDGRLEDAKNLQGPRSEIRREPKTEPIWVGEEDGTAQDLAELDYLVEPVDETLVPLLPAMTVGQRIAWIRLSRGIFQKKDVSLPAKISSSTYAYIENRNEPPESDRLLRIARVLKVDPVLILTGKDFREIAHVLTDAELIKLLRFRKGWTQMDFAKELQKAGFAFDTDDVEKARSTISYWEKGSIPHLAKQGIIRQVLGYPELFRARKLAGIRELERLSDILSSSQIDFIRTHPQATNGMLALIVNLWKTKKSKNVTAVDIGRIHQNSGLPLNSVTQEILSKEDFDALVDFLSRDDVASDMPRIQAAIAKVFHNWKIYTKNNSGEFREVRLIMNNKERPVFDAFVRRAVEGGGYEWGISIQRYNDYDYYPARKYGEEIIFKRPRRSEVRSGGTSLKTTRVEYEGGRYQLKYRDQSFTQWRNLARSVLRILEREFDNLAIQGISADREREVRQILQHTLSGLVPDVRQIVSLRNREILRRLDILRNVLASNNKEVFLSVVRGLNQLNWLQEPELLSTVRLFRGLRDIAENKWQVADSPQRMNSYLDHLEARLKRVDALGWLFQRFVSKYVELRSGENPLSHEDAQKEAFEATVAQGNFDFTRQSDNRTLLLFYQLIFVSSREHSEFLESISRIAGQQAFKAPGRVPDDTSKLATWMPNDLYLWAPQVVLEALSKFEPLRSELRQSKETGKYFVLNKPVGFITTEKQEPNAPDTPIAWNLLPPDVKNGRHFLGRLDKDTSGLLLVGGNAELNQLLLNPKRSPDHKVRKTYKAVVGGHVTEDSVDRLKQGVVISAEGKKYLVQANELRILERFWEGKRRPLTRLEIVISEGKFHQVRTMLRVVGHQVIELQRTAFGPILLENLAPGSWRELSSDEYSWLSGRLLQSSERSPESVRKEGDLDPLTGNRETEVDLPGSDATTAERRGELRSAGGKTPEQHFSSSAPSTKENIAELEKPEVFVIEKGQIEGMLSSELRQLMVFAAINRKNLWLVVPDMLEGRNSQFLEDLKTLGVRISKDLPEIARSSGVRVIGFSDKERDTAGKLRMRLEQRNPRLAEGVKEYFAFEGGNGFFLAQLVSQPEYLAVMNGFRYDKAGRFQAALQAFLNHLMNSYVVTAISA